jgi:hypothetical protein
MDISISENIFHILATPFLGRPLEDSQELELWLREYPTAFSHLDRNQLRLFHSLINRRLILLLRNSQNRNIENLMRAASAWRDIPRLTSDILKLRPMK